MKYHLQGPCLVWTALAAFVLTPLVKADTADKALAADIETVLTRFGDYFLGPACPDAEKFLKSQKLDGSWDDVNYRSKGLTNWAPMTHLDRVKQLACAYAKTSDRLYHSPQALAGVEAGLRFWYAAKPKSDNWWQNQIGQQLQLEQILVVLRHDLPPELMQAGLTYFKDLTMPGKATGQNLVWFAGEYLTHGLLIGNETEIKGSLETIQATIVITKAEGIQVDYAFHQHGPQLYNGGYGLSFLSDSVRYAYSVAGTRFVFKPEKIDLLSAYFLDGSRWMMRGPMFDFSANGRGLSRPTRPGQKATSSLADACDLLAKLDLAHKADFEALSATMRGGPEPWTVLGNKQFWSSDFMVQQTKSLYCSVKMNSKRSTGTEMLNGENLQGYWLPFGLTYIAPAGQEYTGIFPVWDWAHLPGVTSPVAVYPIANGSHQPDSFVGGVSDGQNGAAAMKLDLESPDKSLHAHKAWFFFGDDFVALGSGISSTHDEPVDTTLNQTLLKGPVVADGKTLAGGTHELQSASWVLHDGIGYLFPEKSNMTVNIGSQTGSWQSINSAASAEPVSEDVFSLWIHHGVKPANGAYSYIVVSGADTNKMTAYAANLPVKILSNTTELQAVRNERMGLSQAIFYQPGQVTLRPGLRLQVDQPCMVEVEEASGTAKVVLASPEGNAPVHVTLGNQGLDFDLPTDLLTGSSQTMSIAIP